MKIALDAVAGNRGSGSNIEGAIQAANAWGLKILLVGPAAKLRSELAARSVAASDPRFEILDAADAPVMACASAVAAGRAAAFVSSGPSGATVAAALQRLGALPGVLRPAIAVPIPTSRGISVLIDAGASPDCGPEHLGQFGLMGAAYAQGCMGLERPTVALLSTGPEETEGNELVRRALPLLKWSGLEFLGLIEGQDVSTGAADVVVCEGFTGNVVLKLLEGTASMIFETLKTEMRDGLFRRMGGLLLRRPLARLKRRMSYDQYGGGVLLGVDGTAIVCHARSNAKAVANALRLARELSSSGVNDRIRETLARTPVAQCA